MMLNKKSKFFCLQKIKWETRRNQKKKTFIGLCHNMSIKVIIPT